MSRPTVKGKQVSLDCKIVALEAKLAQSEERSKRLSEAKRQLERRHRQVVAEVREREEERLNQTKLFENLIEAIAAPIFYKNENVFILGVIASTKITSVSAAMTWWVRQRLLRRVASGSGAAIS